MHTPDQIVEQFRRGRSLSTVGLVGFVALKHVTALGHIEIERGEWHAYVVTGRQRLLHVPPFPSEAEAQAFIERCRDASPIGKVRA